MSTILNQETLALPHQRENKDIPTSVRGVDSALWRWLKAQAALENKKIGEKLNDLINEARRTSCQANDSLPADSSIEASPKRQSSDT